MLMRTSRTPAALTETALRAIVKKPHTARRDYADGRGLILRVTPSGSATWSLRFRVRGEGGTTGRGHQLKGDKHRVTLGTYPAMTLAQAREAAAAHRAA